MVQWLIVMVDRCWFSSNLRKIAVFFCCLKVNRTRSWDVHTTSVCDYHFAGETQGLNTPPWLLQRSVDVQPSCQLVLCIWQLWRSTTWYSTTPQTDCDDHERLPEYIPFENHCNQRFQNTWVVGAFPIFHGHSPHIGCWSYASCVLMSDILASKKQQL